MILVLSFQIIAESVIMFLAKYSQALHGIYRFLVDSKIIIATQTEANKVIEGMELDFVNHFVYILRTVWFTLVFSIISPVCLFIGTFGLILSYFIEKYFLSQRYSIPEYGDFRLNSEFIDLLDATPLLIGIFNLFVILASKKDFNYEEIPNSEIVFIMLSIGVGAFNFLMPWQDIVKKYH